MSSERNGMKSAVTTRCLWVISLILVGCGPLTTPMVSRLDEESQGKVDEVWGKLFVPPDRLDRTLLLDVILSGQLHQLGVDDLRLVSEKRAGDGLVVMEVRFNRDHPEFDEFAITYKDAQGREMRREQFSPRDIQNRLEFLFSRPGVDETASPEVQREMQLQVAKWKARKAEIAQILGPFADSSSISVE